MKRINFITTVLFLSFIILLAPITTQAASTSTAKSQAQLEKLLTNKSITTIKIATSKKITLTIPSGDYDKALIINAPNVRLINNGKFSEITIKNLTKYTENTKGNSLNVTDDKLSVSVDRKASLKSITVSNEKAKLHLVADGNVSKLTINSANVIGIHGEHKKSINVISNDVDTRLNVSSLITFTVKNVTNTDKEDTNSNNTSNNTHETIKSDVENKETIDLSEIKQQAYNKAYSDWLNYFITQSQTVNKNTSTNANTQQSNNQTNNKSDSDSISTTTPGAITPTEPDNELLIDNTDEPVEEPVIETEEPVVTYQMIFTHWDNTTAFTSYTGRSQFVYVSNVEDNTTPLEGTDWEVAVVSNNEDSTNESLVWTNLSEATSISGAVDSTYYQNAYKLTFNECGTYYLRAKCGDQYVYSMPITVYTDNATYLETEIDGNTYMTQAQVAKTNATFKITGCTPEEIETLANVSYIKYKNSSVLHRGLYVNHVRTDLNTHTVYYTFDKSDGFNSSGDLFQTVYYNDDYKPLQIDTYTNGVLTKSKISTYDEQGRTYTVITVNYDANGNITSKSGYYYTYDEDGNKITHNGILDTTE